MRRLIWFASVVLLGGAIAGCTGHMRNTQLEEVAKDWSYVVRASQVIPVYPLTEDLQPGDILLVTTPVEQQVTLYKKKGFLPLDQLLKRLNPDSYKAFYLDRYVTDNIGKIPPSNWQELVTEETGKKVHQWDLAPHAAFPSYNFEVSTGTGMNLAVPIQGVPIALGFMNSGKARGSLTIDKAYTYGLDNATLYEATQRWGAQNREMLRAYQPVGKEGKKRYQFLRVVSRVYAVSDVNVTMVNDEATSAQVAGGADKDVTIDTPTENDVKGNFDKAALWNKALQSELPGGKVKFASASHRSVTLKEEFQQPLIIGYVGFDIPILEGGRLGAPVSTLEQLTGTAPAEPVAMGENLYRLAALSHMYKALEQTDGARAVEVKRKLDTLGELLPETYSFTAYELAGPGAVQKSTEVVSGAKLARRNFRDVLDYVGYARTTIDSLQRCLSLPKCEGAEQIVMEADLHGARDAMESANARFGSQPAIAEAVEFVFLGY